MIADSPTVDENTYHQCHCEGRDVRVYRRVVGAREQDECFFPSSSRRMIWSYKRILESKSGNLSDTDRSGHTNPLRIKIQRRLNQTVTYGQQEEVESGIAMVGIIQKKIRIYNGTAQSLLFSSRKLDAPALKRGYVCKMGDWLLRQSTQPLHRPESKKSSGIPTGE